MFDAVDVGLFNSVKVGVGEFDVSHLLYVSDVLFVGSDRHRMSKILY